MPVWLSVLLHSHIKRADCRQESNLYSGTSALMQWICDVFPCLSITSIRILRYPSLFDCVPKLKTSMMKHPAPYSLKQYNNICYKNSAVSGERSINSVQGSFHSKPWYFTGLQEIHHTRFLLMAVLEPTSLALLQESVLMQHIWGCQLHQTLWYSSSLVSDDKTVDTEGYRAPGY